MMTPHLDMKTPHERIVQTMARAPGAVILDDDAGMAQRRLKTSRYGGGQGMTGVSILSTLAASRVYPPLGIIFWGGFDLFY